MDSHQSFTGNSAEEKGTPAPQKNDEFAQDKLSHNYQPQTPYFGAQQPNTQNSSVIMDGFNLQQFSPLNMQQNNYVVHHQLPPAQIQTQNTQQNSFQEIGAQQKKQGNKNQRDRVFSYNTVEGMQPFEQQQDEPIKRKRKRSENDLIYLFDKMEINNDEDSSIIMNGMIIDSQPTNNFNQKPQEQEMQFLKEKVIDERKKRKIDNQHSISTFSPIKQQDQKQKKHLTPQKATFELPNNQREQLLSVQLQKSQKSRLNKSEQKKESLNLQTNDEGDLTDTSGNVEMETTEQKYKRQRIELFRKQVALYKKQMVDTSSGLSKEPEGFCANLI